MKFYFSIFIFSLYLITPALAQQGEGAVSEIMSRTRSFGNMANGQKDSIAFEHRDDAKDSIKITYSWMDSLTVNSLSNSLQDFYEYFSIPFAQQYMGNNGSAGYSMIFKPVMKTGIDAGFHAFDSYMYQLKDTRFFKTTKPFTELNYQLASGKEQLIKIIHTQNPRPNLNVGFEYRLINAPGFFVTQNTNHSNFRLFSQYQSPRKRYKAQFTIISNNINSSENGGLMNDSFLTTTSADYSRRFTIPVKLGIAPAADPNPFSTSVNTGNKYRNFTFFYRHHYDLGKKDSIQINDSTTEYLFYSKLRFQHTFTYQTQQYQFRDFGVNDSIYRLWYDTTLNPLDSFSIKDKWSMLHNDFTLMQFPDTKNLQQFLSAGVRLENINGNFSASQKKFYNIVLHGDYQNKTKNKLWDIQAGGEFYVNGNNSGDYQIHASLQRFLNKQKSNIQINFSNVNRSPSYIFNPNSSFNFQNNTLYNKENISVLHAILESKFATLEFANYTLSNYLYFKNYKQTEQYSKLLNVLMVSAKKKIKINKKWSWTTEATVQKTDESAPIKLPLIFTRNRIAYEGILYKNLNLCTGIEARYYTGFNAYHYSPVMGQFVYQDSITIRNLPDISAFVHFRIKSFTGYVRAENLNTLNVTNGFAFTHNNMAAPQYAYAGFIFRFGIKWKFVN